MWVTKLLISPVKIRIFCPKKSKFDPKMAFLFILGQALPAHLVGGCGARAVSRKTPIYFIVFVQLYLQFNYWPSSSIAVVLIKIEILAVLSFTKTQSRRLSALIIPD